MGGIVNLKGEATLTEVRNPARTCVPGFQFFAHGIHHGAPFLGEDPEGALLLIPTPDIDAGTGEDVLLPV